MTQTTSVSVATTARPIPAARPRRRLATLGRWGFVLPALLLNLFVIGVPSFISLYYAFTDWTGLGAPNFIGLENFVRLFTNDRVIFRALGNNLVWTAIFLIVPVIMGLVGAYLLSGIRRGQMFYRVAFFFPYVIASVVNAQLWRYLLSPRFGIGTWLAEHGIPLLDRPWLGSGETALYAIAFVDNWHFWGFLVVIYLAAMHNVDVELYEVARLEGANRLQQFRHVTLPSIRPTLVFTLLLITIWSFLVFDYVYILTGGGPAHASEVLATHLYSSAFDRFEVGYAASIGVFMGLIIALVFVLFALLRQFVLKRRGWEI